MSQYPTRSLQYRSNLTESLNLFLLLLLAFALPLGASTTHTKLTPVPAEVASSHFRVSINGYSSKVLHAADGYYLLNFDTDGPISIAVTAEDAHFWDAGVEVQPMRLGIRPHRFGATVTFTLGGPEKIVLSRPGDHFADADLLFLFANPIEHADITERTPGLRYYGPGVHRENIDARSGDRIYVDAGAVIFGSINLWQVEDVRIFGRGTVIYDGPQNPHVDEGWMHKRNWHVMVMDEAKNIEVDGITCITRSRSWQIQMKDSHHIGFYNVKVLGGNPNDANQDGMDWLGGGDTTVSHSFFRASDDVFALQGNWDGYDLDLMRRPGHDVRNISIDSTMVSTSISNTVRVGWPEKTFNSSNFRMSDIDVLHTGYGGCKVPFAFFELWADPNGKGDHTSYTFENIRLEDWYSLFQIRQPSPSVREIAFRDIWALDGPGMVPSVLKGEVADVNLRGATLQGFENAEFDRVDGAVNATTQASVLDAHFTYTAGVLRPGQTVIFHANLPTAVGERLEWLFGDGTRAIGAEIRHRFPDAAGSLLDGSGRFRVALHRSDSIGHHAWAVQQVVVAIPLYRHSTSTALPVTEWVPADIESTDLTFTIPTDGGYTFTLLTSTTAVLGIDNYPPIRSSKPRPQVCGAPGNAVQPMRISAVLSAGLHHIYVERSHEIENVHHLSSLLSEEPFILWEGPGVERQPLQSALRP